MWLIDDRCKQWSVLLKAKFVAKEIVFHGYLFHGSLSVCRSRYYGWEHCRSLQQIGCHMISDRLMKGEIEWTPQYTTCRSESPFGWPWWSTAWSRFHVAQKIPAPLSPTLSLAGACHRTCRCENKHDEQGSQRLKRFSFGVKLNQTEVVKGQTVETEVLRKPNRKLSV